MKDFRSSDQLDVTDRPFGCDGPADRGKSGGSSWQESGRFDNVAGLSQVGLRTL